MSNISIADEEKKLNEVLEDSKERLAVVREKIKMLSQEHRSIL